MTDVDARDDELRRLTVLYWLGQSDSVAVESWIAAEYEYNADPDPNLCRLYSYNDETERWLCHLAKSQLGFVPTSHAGVKVAQLILASYLQRFLNNEIQPHKFCSLVNAIDGQFLDAIPTDDPKVAYYPEWLGDLWNCCDCCDTMWTSVSEPHLVQEAQAVLAQLIVPKSTL